jgi:hypothetical protein
MGKPNTAAYRTLWAFYQPVRPPDSDRPALPTVAALDESFRGKLAPVDYPCLNLCEGVYEPPSSRDTQGDEARQPGGLRYRCAALRCVALCCAPPPVEGVQPPS